MKVINFILKMIILGVFSVVLYSCAQNKQWRSNFDLNCSPNNENTKCLIEKHENYDLAFLEFTERGNLFKSKAKKIVLSRIESYSKKKEGIAVIVFVHGWKHNASFEDSNVVSFKKALNAVASNKKNILGNRKIFGVYLGWRGLSLHGLWSENLTFWDRKAVAQEIGKGGVTDTLLRLEQIDQHQKKNILFVVGHSFGGAVVLSALNETLLERAIFKKFHPENRVEQFGDGIILINPAIEANQILQLVDVAHEITNNEQKIIHVISTEGDCATKIAFPIGQFLDQRFTLNHKILSRNYNKKSYAFSEYSLYLSTVGNYKPFHTRNLIKEKTTVQGVAASNNQIIEKWKYVNCCQNIEECNLSNDADFHISCHEDFPISFLYTSESFINDHNDVFNKNVLAYFSTVVSEALSKQDRKPFKECTDQESGKFNFGNCFDFHYSKLTAQ
jgi:hypothetical protein